MTQLPALDQAQHVIADLVERFAHNLDAYQRSDYKEIEVRHEYIDPFFEALGWDVHNRAGYSQGYKDLTHDESPRVASSVVIRTQRSVRPSNGLVERGCSRRCAAKRRSRQPCLPL